MHPDRPLAANAARLVRALALTASALLVAACATPQTDAVRASMRGTHDTLGIAPARDLGNRVPYFAQEKDQCGPATLAMVLGATGSRITPDSVRASVFTPGRHGSFAPEMLAAARRNGRLAVQLPPRLDAVLREVDAGNPVIVLQNLGLAIYPVWHYSVVVGYDVPAGIIWLRSGPEPHEAMPMTVFEHTWDRSGDWAMVATDPRRLPVTPSLDALLDATAALERVDVRASHHAYAALTRLAPRSYAAWMGLGNSAFEMDDPADAVTAFRRAVALQPAEADAWNNLAASLLAQHRLAGARAAIARALALGGSHHDLYEQTAREIDRAGKMP